MLKLRDLASRPDFDVGPLSVSPSRRRVSGPAGEVNVEPLIMQVFLLLLDSGGRVVTRDELFEQCWGGVMVGDASLNRAIAGVRRIGSETAPGLFEIETIPRTGYRLVGDILQSLPSNRPGGQAGLSRRALVGGGVAAAIAAAGAGLWLAKPQRNDPRFDALMDRGREALRLDEPGSEKYFREASAIEPRNASAWGLLAYSLASGRSGEPTDGTAQATERAATTALDIDPNEPNANLALVIVQPLDWYSREQGFRRVLAADPGNAPAMAYLGQLLHGVGRCRESLEITDRVIAVEPLNPEYQFRRAMRLWVLGRNAEADQVIDRAMELWPSHPLVRLARIMIYAFTGRPRAALAVVDARDTGRLISPSVASIWRKSLVALDSRTPAAIGAAHDAIVEGSKGTPPVAAWGIAALSAMGEIDAAFDIADGLLLGRGPILVLPLAEGSEPRINGERNTSWRNTNGLFIPPTKPMRLDPRFKPLCDGLGLTQYWRRRGIGPDAFLFEA